MLCAIFIVGWPRRVVDGSQDRRLYAEVDWRVLWYGVSQNEFVAREKASADGRAEGATLTPEAG